jgi:hypothetical protein
VLGERPQVLEGRRVAGHSSAPYALRLTLRREPDLDELADDVGTFAHSAPETEFVDRAELIWREERICPRERWSCRGRSPALRGRRTSRIVPWEKRASHCPPFAATGGTLIASQPAPLALCEANPPGVFRRGGFASHVGESLCSISHARQAPRGFHSHATCSGKN